MATAAPATTPPSANDKEHPRRPWKPDGNDHLIFQWVKMEGKTQSWVASALGIDQSTVSRIIQRYERWQAHAKEREGGRLDPAERLRAQRWLTFERNELILSSCMRIANEMEGFIDTSKSTIRRPASSPSRETEVRTEHARIDRTGSVARFLRLAFRINMEQLKLAELDPPPPAEPLSAEELAEQDREAAAAAEEFLAARGRATQAHEWERQRDGEMDRGSEGEAEEEHAAGFEERPPPEQPKLVPPTESAPADLIVTISPSLPPTVSPSLHPAPVPAEPSTTDHSPTHHSPTPVHNVHNLHNENTPEIGASAAEPCSCVPEPHPGKNSLVPCITDNDQPQRSSHTPEEQARGPDDGRPKRSKRRQATAAAS